ncbi:MAG: histidinol-phosphate transaminase [Steroidobacteraceae bacterium]
MSELLALARPEILGLAPYAHAAWDPVCVRLHANENPWTDEAEPAELRLNRYPEPRPKALHDALAAYYGVTPDRLLACRGSDEGIDLLVRAFCQAGSDRVLICPPTFAMYGFAAAVQGAGIVEVPLDDRFDLDVDAVLAQWSPGVKIVFLCSPNNPTGNRIDPARVERVLARLSGRALVVVDEAYIELAESPSCLALQARFAGLVVLRTLSKAHGLAGARCGVVLAQPAIIELLARILAPYALPAPTLAAVQTALAPDRLQRMRTRVQVLLAERERIGKALSRLPCVRRVWRSDANFLLVKFRDAKRANAAALQSGLLVRDFSSRPRLEGCLRITIGAPPENDHLVASLESA